MASVVLRNICKTYAGGVSALRGLSLDIADGEFVTIVGPSGSGKSTLLRLISGLEQPSEGTIVIDGRDVTGIRASERGVAMVFQTLALYPHMTARENMAFALRHRGAVHDEVERRVIETARQLEIDGLLERLPGELSGGERQRVALGRALVRKPLLALFDEPLSSLDERLRAAMRAELRQLRSRIHTTSIYVTHRHDEALALGDRVIVMNDGVVEQIGTPAEVYALPANRFVASFFSSPAMNFIDGRIESRDGSLWFVSQQGGDEGGGSLRLRVSPRHAQSLASRTQRSVTLGLRPGAFVEHGSADAAAETWRFQVKTVEYLGECADVTCLAPHGAVVLRLPIREGLLSAREVVVTPNSHQAMWFEPDAQARRIDVETR